MKTLAIVFALSLTLLFVGCRPTPQIERGPANQCTIRVQGAVNETGKCSVSLTAGVREGTLSLSISHMMGIFQPDPTKATAIAEMVSAALTFSKEVRPGTVKLITLEKFEKSLRPTQGAATVMDLRRGFGFRRFGTITEGEVALTSLEPFQGHYRFTAKRTQVANEPPLSPVELAKRITVDGSFIVY